MPTQKLTTKKQANGCSEKITGKLCAKKCVKMTNALSMSLDAFE